MYTNVQSLMAHREEIFHHIMKQRRPAIVALSEARVDDSVEDFEINIIGYSCMRCDAENRFTGGVVIYIRNDIKYETVLVKKIIGNCWCVVIKINGNWYRGAIAVVYHSPSAPEGVFIKFVEDIVEEVIMKGDCIVIGDFNIDLSRDTFYSNTLRKNMLGLGMKQFVNQPTRVTRESSTLIDLVFASLNLSECVEVIESPKITDHAWIKIKFKIDKERENCYIEFRGRSYKNMDIQNFVSILHQSMKEDKEVDVSKRASSFVNYIVSALDMVAPERSFRIPKAWEGKLWFTEDIKRVANDRDRAYAKAIGTGLHQDWMQYKRERNRVINLIKYKKKQYYQNMIDNNKSDAKSMWKVLKEVVKGENANKSSTDRIDFEGINVNEEMSAADKFNKYYIKSIDNIISSIRQVGIHSRDGVGAYNSNKKSKGVIEYFDPTDTAELEKIVIKLPKKKGTEEGISVDVIKAAFHTIKEEFVEIINRSLALGECPNGWKTSTVIPIPKVKKPIKASEYRPINVLPVYEKVLELVVKAQLEKYLEKNEVLTEHQSGFRKAYSCETAIQGTIDEWKVEIEGRKIVGVIFMDLKRAFETVDRQRLLGKLNQIGIRGKVLDWLGSYLYNRSQKVRFNNVHSKSMAVGHGVPQGSVLGPLLFVLYINDIIEACPKGSSVKLFADDTLIYVTGESSEEINKKLNEVFYEIQKWMSVNKLKLNASKTKYMIVRSNRKEVRGQIKIVCMDGEILERVEEIKYLGVMIDSKLTFAGHCDYIVKKVGKKTSFLNRCGQYLSMYSRQIVYKSIIAPHFEYCSTVMVGMGETQIDKLQVAQNRAMRVILQCKRDTRREDMWQALHYMSIRQRIYYNTCIFIFKILRGYLPQTLRGKFIIREERNQRENRQTGNIVLELRKTSGAQRSVFYRGVKMYNNLTNEVKQCVRLETFKRLLKVYILNNVTRL